MDDRGEVLFASSKKERCVTDPPQIDKLAILRHLQLCIHRGINNLILESDSLIMIMQTIQAERTSL